MKFFRRQVFLLAASGLSFTFSFAQPQTTTEVFIFPLVVTGEVDSNSHFATDFSFLALSTTTVQASVVVFDQNGENPPVFCAVPVGSVSSFYTTVMADGLSTHLTTGARPLVSGWAKVTFEEDVPVQASAEIVLLRGRPTPCPPVICNRPSTDKLADVRIPAVSPALEFRVQATRNENRHSAFSIVNPSDDAANVELIVFSPDGVQVAARVLTLEPHQARSAFLEEFLIPPVHGLLPPLLPDPFRGAVHITSDVPIAVGALDVLFPEGKLLNLLVTSVPAD